jgi:hypothetical protein
MSGADERAASRRGRGCEGTSPKAHEGTAAHARHVGKTRASVASRQLRLHMPAQGTTTRSGPGAAWHTRGNAPVACATEWASRSRRSSAASRRRSCRWLHRRNRRHRCNRRTRSGSSTRARSYRRKRKAPPPNLRSSGGDRSRRTARGCRGTGKIPPTSSWANSSRSRRSRCRRGSCRRSSTRWARCSKPRSGTYTGLPLRSPNR